MPHFSIDLVIPPNEVFSEIQQSVSDVNYKIKTIIPNQSIIAEGGRDFNLITLIILAILLWPVALVYYLTRQRSSITATISNDSENECSLTITSNGNSGDNLTRLIQNVLQEDKAESEDKP